MSYQWYSEAIFIITVTVILGIVVYIILASLLKVLMFIYDYIRDCSDEILEDIKYRIRR